jgi:hypothetical protein
VARYLLHIVSDSCKWMAPDSHALM